MRRLAVLLLSLLVVIAGCARQSPVQTSEPAASASVARLRVGATSDPTMRVLAELYVQALAAKGRPASIIEVSDEVNAQVSRLMADELDVVPAFAWSAAPGLEVDTSDPQNLVSDLAAALDGEAVVLQPSKVDRAWRYVSARANVSLLGLAKTATIVAPQRWRTASDGPTGLAAIYGLRPTIAVEADPDRRLARVKAGAIGVFDGTEPQAANPAVKPVGDPRSMIASDPQVALLRIELSEDDAVLEAIQQLHGKLDNAAVIGIRTRAAASSVPAAVTEWLKAHPLG